MEGLHSSHTLTDDDGNNLQLVHRDVSPQNILVGTDGLARITDFGIAKAEARITSTQPGMRKGKLAFMAPEQIMNDEAIDQRADIWAAGVVLWTALTGKHLFRAANDAGTIHGVLTKPVEAPSTLVEGAPPFFDEIVLRALDRDPNNRFSSAFEMAEALRAAAHGNGMSCSKHKVAQWVTETFGDELRARRQAIRAAAARRLEEQDHTEASRITVLSVLPTVGPHSKVGTGSLSRSAVGSYTPPGLAPSSLPPDAPSGSISPYASQPPLLSPAEIALIQEARPSRKGLWVTAGILTLALVGSVLYLMRSKDSGQEPVQSVATQPNAVQPAPGDTRKPPAPAAKPPSDPAAAGAQAPGENVQPTTPEQLAAEKPETEEAAAEEAEGDDKSASKRVARPRVTRSYARRPAARAERESASEEAAPEPKPEAPAAQRPLPKPATGGVVIENNPYMRK